VASTLPLLACSSINLNLINRSKPRNSFLHTFCLISYRVSNTHKDMDHVGFDNQGCHTSRTLVLLLHSNEFQDPD